MALFIQTLKSFNFGVNFNTWIKFLYTYIFSSMSNKGYLSNNVSLSRGIRQGFPISALLFILVAEISAINIRFDLKIKGIQVLDKTFKICQLADDTTLFKKIFSLFKELLIYSLGDCQIVIRGASFMGTSQNKILGPINQLFDSNIPRATSLGL